MRKLLNTLFITTPEAYLHKEGENVVVKVNGELKGRVPIHNIESIVCFNYVGVTPRLMEICVRNNTLISFISNTGKFLAKVEGGTSGNVLLRTKQYKNSEEEVKVASLVKSIVLGKLLNYKAILMRFARDHNERTTSEFIENIRELERTIKRLHHYSGVDIDSLRGYEGMGSMIYYKNMNNMILSNKDVFYFHERSKRPPMDRFNCLLSFLYTLLTHECTSALEMVGLDPQVGFLHKMRPGRCSLSLDLVEELRGYLGDRLALSLVNNRMIGKSDFYEKENGAILLNDDGRKKTIEAYQLRKKEVITHPFLNEKIEIGLIPYSQAMLLARVIRGDMESYPTFMIK